MQPSLYSLRFSGELRGRPGGPVPVPYIWTGYTTAARWVSNKYYDAIIVSVQLTNEKNKNKSKKSKGRGRFAMSRKYNGCRKGKKARGVGNCGMSKHRSSGGKGSVTRTIREATARLVNDQRDAKRKRLALTPMYDSVREAMDKS